MFRPTQSPLILTLSRLFHIIIAYVLCTSAEFYNMGFGATKSLKGSSVSTISFLMSILRVSPLMHSKASAKILSFSSQNTHFTLLFSVTIR